MYEVQFHVGSAFSSVQSSSCEIQFTIYGTNNVIGPVILPVSPFEQDGVASFLISTMKPLGEIGTICLFCKDMNLRYSFCICHHPSSSIHQHLFHTTYLEFSNFCIQFVWTCLLLNSHRNCHGMNLGFFL